MNELKYSPGDIVKILPPFNDSFNEEYTVTEIVVHDDGSVVFVLGELGGFDSQYLEKV